MGMPPPKLRDLSQWTDVQDNLQEMWEIGVPKKNSLYWSIVLAYLLSASETIFPKFVINLTGDDEEVIKIQEKKKMSQVKINHSKVIKELNTLNPFKNRHTFFQQSKEVNTIFRIFDLRLKRYANELKKKTDEWNDDLKLNAASMLLKCVIEVYFPEDVENRKLISYPKAPNNFQTKLVLFQYENQQHGARREKINVFHFAMTVEKAQGLQLDAMDHILKKTHLNREIIAKIKTLMTRRDNRGQRFLSTILQNKPSILPHIYRSTYISLKLSEAGFETDPTVTTVAGELSAFGNAALCDAGDSRYNQILYDYASNCCRLFDRSVRRADDVVLDSLKQIKVVMEKDVDILQRCEYNEQSKNRALNILKQFICFSKYQLKMASDLVVLQEKQAELGEFQFRKQIIVSILSNYLNVFTKSTRHDHDDLPDMFTDYFNSPEYNNNVDNFTHVLFFDHFYRLRLCINLKQENVFLNIEWKLFLAMISKKYFLKPDPGMQYQFEFGNVMQYIPIMHRNAVRNEISAALTKLMDASKPEEFQKSLKIKELMADDPHALPQVKDELLIAKLMVHIIAALEVLPYQMDNRIKDVLVIERALQVIGESTKPPSTSSSSVRYLLRSCLSTSLQEAFVAIRNSLSHCKISSVHRRLVTEEDINIFNEIKKPLEEIKNSFKIVAFTQYLRIEETVMVNFLEEYQNKLKEEKEAFYEKYNLRVSEREELYKNYHSQCIQLLWNNVNKLQETVRNEEKKNIILGWLKSIEFLIGFILRHNYERYLDEFAQDIKTFIENCNGKEIGDIKKNLDFLPKHIEVLRECMDISQENANSNSSIIERLSHMLTKNNSNRFSKEDEISIGEAVQNAYKDAEDAKQKLKDLVVNNSCLPNNNLEQYLGRLLMPTDKVDVIRSAFNSNQKIRNPKDEEKALMYLKKVYIRIEALEDDVKKMLKHDTMDNVYFSTLLTKIVYQRYLSSDIYTSAILSKSILEKLEKFLTSKVIFLLTRLKAIKNILIDEDDDIKETWTWGRSEAIKHHMKFLMRQRYMKEVNVRAALDMAFFDCANILDKGSMRDLFEKSTDLFAGVNLRNLAAHCTNMETFGAMMDKDDFPSAMVEKMLALINDTEAIEAILKLFTVAGELSADGFKKWIEKGETEKYDKEIKAVISCERWDSYLSLFPFVKV